MSKPEFTEQQVYEAVIGWISRHPRALTALITGKACVMPLQLSDAALFDVGVMKGYGGTSYSTAEEDHLEWYESVVAAARLDRDKPS